MWVLVFMAFEFINPANHSEIIMSAWKHPYPFSSQAECQEMAKESHRLAPQEFFKHACIEIEKP